MYQVLPKQWTTAWHNLCHSWLRAAACQPIQAWWMVCLFPYLAQIFRNSCLASQGCLLADSRKSFFSFNGLGCFAWSGAGIGVNCSKSPLCRRLWGKLWENLWLTQKVKLSLPTCLQAPHKVKSIWEVTGGEKRGIVRRGDLLSKWLSFYC